MTATKEKPILFGGEMVRAILNGRKTQTRRIVKFGSVLSPAQRKIGFKQCPDLSLFRASRLVKGVPRLCVPVRHPDDRRMPWEDCSAECIYAPYEIGTRLWIKTGYVTRYDAQFDWTFWNLPVTVQFVVTDGRAISKTGRPKRDGGHPGMFMPHWLSKELRLPTLEITDIRVRRLQEISEEDAAAEGVGRIELSPGPSFGRVGGLELKGHPLTSTHGHAFRVLWDSINTKPGTRWGDNPWVWAYTFRRVEE